MIFLNNDALPTFDETQFLNRLEQLRAQGATVAIIAGRFRFRPTPAELELFRHVSSLVDVVGVIVHAFKPGGVGYGCGCIPTGRVRVSGESDPVERANELASLRAVQAVVLHHAPEELRQAFLPDLFLYITKVGHGDNQRTDDARRR